MSLPVAQLSCEQCQRRKTKCSKTVPCSACSKAGIACTAVHRQRRPRGRSGKTASPTDRRLLQERVRRLESVVQQLQQPNQRPSDPSTSAEVLERAMIAESSVASPLQSFVAPDFWTDLSGAVAGLKEVLERPGAEEQSEGTFENDESQEYASRSVPVTEEQNDSHCLLFTGIDEDVTAHSLGRDLKDHLIHVYKERVDSLFKPLHWPSALSIIKLQRLDGSHEANPAFAKALEYAIYFTGACSVFDHELSGRPALVEHLRRSTEKALADAGLLTTPSLTVLQAFVVYLAGIRACQANALQWTLTAIAIRVASAQGMPHNLASAEKSLEMETRRRLWHCIGVLDLQGAFDRGSQPLIKSNELHPLPLNVNDWELHEHLSDPASAVPQPRWTEMSLSLITYGASLCQRRLTEIGVSVAMGHCKTDAHAAGQEQLAVLAKFEREVRELSEVCGSSPSTLQKYAKAVAEECLVAMRLLIYRPLHRRKKGHIPFEAVHENGFNILEVAIEVLERSQMKRTQTEFAPWAWFQWVKWYALAVVLAELCGCEKGPLADRAWTAAQLSFTNYAKDVADTRKGLLWKPIVRLMRKVENIRRQQEIAQQSLHSHSANAQDYAGYNPKSDTIAPTMSPALMELDDHEETQDGGEFLIDMPDILGDSTWSQWEMLIDDFNDPNLFDD